MTWWADQLRQHGTAYAIGAVGAAVLWVFTNVFRNMLIMQHQKSQITEMRGDIKGLHAELDATNRRIDELLQFLAGQHGAKPHITPKPREHQDD